MPASPITNEIFMSPLTTIPSSELANDKDARLWALIMYLAEHKEAQTLPGLKSFWLAYIYDAEVQNGGHLQYFHNRGSASVPETLEALRTIGADRQVELLRDCWADLANTPVPQTESLQAYADLAAEDRFERQDSEYYEQQPEVLERLGTHYETQLVEWVAVA
ncbi:hypothetical protein QF040_004363 [Variovorax sp. W2I14]